jgi:hypothetical protein
MISVAVRRSGPVSVLFAGSCAGYGRLFAFLVLSGRVAGCIRFMRRKKDVDLMPETDDIRGHGLEDW